MSRHPDNPLWDQAGDRPIAILDEHGWHQAKRAGHLTLDHVLHRLEDMLEFEFGNGEELGIGEDGFLTALVADSYQVPRSGIKVYIRTEDHPPPHVHVAFPGEEAGLAIELATGEPRRGEAVPRGRTTHMKMIRNYLIEEKQMLLAEWERIHPTSV